MNDDLISRQTAIDALHMHLMYRLGTDSNKKRLDEWINNLPPAQPTIEPSASCSEFPNNSDTISRQAAIDALAEHEKSRGHNYTLFVDIVSECAEIIRDLPPAQPERQAGKWQMVYHNDYRTVGHIECDQCGYHTKGHMKYNFCPNCGADMRGEQDE